MIFPVRRYIFGLKINTIHLKIETSIVKGDKRMFTLCDINTSQRKIVYLLDGTNIVKK